jgi:hypothetical protein
VVAVAVGRRTPLSSSAHPPDIEPDPTGETTVAALLPGEEHTAS